MEIIRTQNYEEMSKKAIEEFLSHLKNLKDKKRINVAITAGNSPKLFYEILVKEIVKLDFIKKIHFYNFDELPLKGDLTSGLTIIELDKLFFSKVDISKNNIHKLTVLNYKEHIKQLYQDGGLDLVLLGIGTDGHFCGNMSGVTRFGDRTRLIRNKDFVEVSKIDLSNFDINILDENYVTMGPRDIMAAGKLIMIANGKGKAEVINQIINGPVIEEVPSSVLTLHPYFTLIVDEEAYSQLVNKNKIRK